MVFALYDNLAQFIDGNLKNNGLEAEEVISKIVSATLHSAHRRVVLKKPAVITLEHTKVLGNTFILPNTFSD